MGTSGYSKYNKNLTHRKDSEFETSDFNNLIPLKSQQKLYVYEIQNESFPNGRGFEYIENSGVNTVIQLWVKLVKTVDSTLNNESGTNQTKTTSNNINSKQESWKLTRNVKVDGWLFEGLDNENKQYIVSYIDYSPTEIESKIKIEVKKEDIVNPNATIPNAFYFVDSGTPDNIRAIDYGNTSNTRDWDIDHDDSLPKWNIAISRDNETMIHGHRDEILYLVERKDPSIVINKWNLISLPETTGFKGRGFEIHPLTGNFYIFWEDNANVFKVLEHDKDDPTNILNEYIIPIALQTPNLECDISFEPDGSYLYLIARNTSSKKCKLAKLELTGSIATITQEWDINIETGISGFGIHKLYESETIFIMGEDLYNSNDDKICFVDISSTLAVRGQVRDISDAHATQGLTFGLGVSTEPPEPPEPPSINPITLIDNNGTKFWKINNFSTVDNKDKTAKNTNIILTKLDDELTSNFNYNIYYGDIPVEISDYVDTFKFMFPRQAMLSGLSFYGYGNPEIEYEDAKSNPNKSIVPLIYQNIGATSDVGIVFAHPVSVRDQEVIMATEWAFNSWYSWDWVLDITIWYGEMKTFYAPGNRLNSGGLFPSRTYNADWDKWSMFDRDLVDYKDELGGSKFNNPVIKIDWYDTNIMTQLLQSEMSLMTREATNLDLDPNVTNDFCGIFRMKTYQDNKIIPLEKVWFHSLGQSMSLLMFGNESDISTGIGDYSSEDSTYSSYYWITAWGHNTPLLNGAYAIHNTMFQLQSIDTSLTNWNVDEAFQKQGETNTQGIFWEAKMKGILRNLYYWQDTKETMWSTIFEIEPTFTYAKPQEIGFDNTRPEEVKIRTFEVQGIWYYGATWGYNDGANNYIFQLGNNVIPKYWDKTETKFRVIW